MSKLWQKTEISYLKRYATKKSLDELAQRFHTDVDTVRTKLEELGLVASPTAAPATDAAIEDFEQALPLLHEGKWEKAAELLRKVIEDTDGRRLRDRARQLLTAAERRMTGEHHKDADFYLRAVYEKNQGNFGNALELLGKADESERTVYLHASILALDGEEDEALELLGKAIELEPKNRVHAYHDPDFEPIRGRDDFRRLLATGS